jgi:hypothetical protein
MDHLGRVILLEWNFIAACAHRRIFSGAKVGHAPPQQNENLFLTHWFL